MVRIIDSIWNHVKKTDEVWKCRFCDHVFAKGTAAQIVKCHLAGVGGSGTKFCSDVPVHVKMEAHREIIEGEKKRRIIVSTSPSSSSNVTAAISPKNDGERMIEQEIKLPSRDGGVVEREGDQEMTEAEFPAVMVKNGDSVCEICWHVYERRTPAKRRQWHLADIGGSGETICTSMPDDDKIAILQEITESKRKRRKTVPGSSHTEDVPTMSIEDVAVQPLEAGWSGITKALEDLHKETDHGVRDEKMVEVEDASVKDGREKETTGKDHEQPGDFWQPIEKDHEQSGVRQEKAEEEVLVNLQSANTIKKKLKGQQSVSQQLRKVVLGLDIKHEKEKLKVMKTVSSLRGIQSVALSVAEKKLTIIGDVDPVNIVSKLRKVCRLDVLAVGPAIGEKNILSVGPAIGEENILFRPAGDMKDVCNIQ